MCPGCALAAIGLAVGLSAAPASAGDLTHYRGHVLGSSVADVLRVSQARPSEVATVHERPSLIQSLEWRTPYTSPDGPDVDPAKAITFAFIDGQLYELVVNYDRARTEGLTTADLVAGVAAVYGTPTSPEVQARESAMVARGAVILARWEDVEASVVLIRGPYDDLQLIVRSAELEGRAKTAMAASVAQDAADAPARRQEARNTADAAARAERARNKAGFRP